MCASLNLKKNISYVLVSVLILINFKNSFRILLALKKIKLPMTMEYFKQVNID